MFLKLKGKWYAFDCCYPFFLFQGNKCFMWLDVTLHLARASAEDAIQRMQGKMIGQQVVQISWGSSLTARQDVPGGWGQPVDPNQWNAYYAYGQGYEAYAYGATQDPSSYAYGAYAGFAQYPQQVEGAQDMSAVSMPTEELYDPMAMPDVDKLNTAYVSIHGSAILGRSLWQKTSPFLQQA